MGSYWHHSIRLFPDLVTKGAKTVATLEKERAAIIGLLAMQGRSVLDIGTWNGYFAFEAKRAGAARVIGADSFCWDHPAYRGRETFDLGRECLGLDIEAVHIDPVDLPGDLKPADIVLFLGVFYHLIDPIAVLQQVAALARDVLVIETHQDALDVPRPAMIFYPRETLNNDPSNWWGPNPECMTELLETVGFRHVFYQHHPESRGQRGIYHAFRSADSAGKYLARRPDNVTLFDLIGGAGRGAVFASARPHDTGAQQHSPPGPPSLRQLITSQARRALRQIAKTVR
jgi:tRNA (mo5U34)-methyltransferase